MLRNGKDHDKYMLLVYTHYITLIIATGTAILGIVCPNEMIRVITYMYMYYLIHHMQANIRILLTTYKCTCAPTVPNSCSVREVFPLCM